MALDDGEATLTTVTSRLEVTEKTPKRVVVALQEGGAQFRIRHNEARTFRVLAGSVAIDDLGTVFRVERRDGEHVQVAVTEGKVAVAYPVKGALRHVDLVAGESGVFPPEDSAEGTFADAAAEGTDQPRNAAPVPDRVDSWRAFARHGQYAKAYRLLEQSRFHDMSDDPAELVLAADAARLSHHAQASVAPLERLLSRHPNDPRAPAAAFTLGWVLMNDLHRPREAATAFAQSERLSPQGTLAEDASARGAEALYQAGDWDGAQRAVRRYAQRYPSGRHRALLERLVEGR